jgi:taurine dioxygenase
LRVTRLGKHIGARVEGVDLGKLDNAGFAAVEAEFHAHGVIAVCDQHLGEGDLIGFSRRLGELEINVSSSFHHPDFPHINILSNKRRPDGKNLGSPDAGQGWHTDMSYNATPARASMLYALEVPMRDGEPLGDTLFCGMEAAYQALPEAMRQRIEGVSAIHHFSKFYDYMIAERG